MELAIITTVVRYPTHSLQNGVTYIKRRISMTKKGKAFPVQAQRGPNDFWWSRLPVFLDNRHVQVVRLSALNTTARGTCS
jgi:hypothetical protein